MNTTETRRMHLVDDEIVTVKVQSSMVRPFRIRIWRREDGPAVVLSSMIKPGGTPPIWASSNLANYAYRNMLRYPSMMPSFFEAEWDDKFERWSVRRVTFDFFGQGQRQHLWRPMWKRLAPEVIEQMIGGKLDL